MITQSEQRGFTVIELMTTLLIAAILAAIAVPGFKTFIQNSQQRNTIVEVNALLSRMRTEVAARHVGVTACASTDQSSCSNAVEWEAGWILFVDSDADGTHDAGELILQVHAALPPGITLRTLGPASKLTLDSSGLPTATTGATFRYCDERGLPSLRAIVVGPSGMVRAVSDGNDHTGTAIASCT